MPVRGIIICIQIAWRPVIRFAAILLKNSALIAAFTV
jgi:hypothetical protein